MKTKLLSGNKIAAFTPDVASETICYPVNTPEKVDFVAYHPYVTLVNTYEYSVNVVTQNSQTKIDLMVAENNNNGTGYNKTNTQPLNLKFYHQLARVVLNVKAGANVTIPNKDDNKTYEWIINNATNINNVTSLEKGKVYTFNITIQETKVEVGGTIKGWGPIDYEAIGPAN